MRVVAQIDRDTFLVHATKEEMARINGRDYANTDFEPKVGTEFSVSKRYAHLQSMERNGKKLKEAAAALREVATAIEAKIDTVKHPCEEI